MSCRSPIRFLGFVFLSVVESSPLFVAVVGENSEEKYVKESKDAYLRERERDMLYVTTYL